MKEVALLVCDQPNKEYLDDFGDYSDMFSASFPSIEFTTFNLFKNEFPLDVKKFKAFFMTGSRYSVYDDYPWISKGKQLIREIYIEKLKFIGVCFGHQMLAEALGGKVSKAETGWNVGIKEFNITKKKKWMLPNVSSFHVQMMCQDQITQLPSGAETLASAPDCPYGMITVDDHMFSLQGHPEFPINYGISLLNSRVERIGKEKSMQALKTYNSEVDLELINKYILNFLEAT
jgi:GMP synthase-like glutamine amidotransferase